MNQQLKARNEALEKCKPGGFENISQTEKAAFISGFLGGWLAGLDECQQEIEALRSTLAEYERHRAEFETWLAGVRSY